MVFSINIHIAYSHIQKVFIGHQRLGLMGFKGVLSGRL